jgi:plastocyanin
MRSVVSTITPPALFRLLVALASLALAAGIATAGSPEPGVRMTPIPGDARAWRIETAHGTTIARRSLDPVQPAAATAVAEVRIFPASFDMDGDSLATLRDTILVAPQTVVRWVRRGPGFHTVTNGVDSGDPMASSEYNEIFTEDRESYERAFTTAGTHNFFCYIHGFTMGGTIIVTNALADAGGPGIVRQAGFTLAPAPNPSRAAVRFAIALPRAAPVRLSVHDVAGRVVATIHDGPLPAGEHPFRWDARGRDGRRVESGRYFVRFVSGDVQRTRAISITR